MNRRMTLPSGRFICRLFPSHSRLTPASPVSPLYTAVIAKDTKDPLNTLLRDGAVKNGNCPSAGRRASVRASYFTSLHERFELPSGKLRSFVTDVLAVVASSLKLHDSSQDIKFAVCIMIRFLLRYCYYSFLIFLSNKP